MGRAALDLNQEGFPHTQSERRMYYGGNGKLHAVDTRALYRHPAQPSNGAYYGFSRSFEEYRYDALGRRVVTKFDQECDQIVEFNLHNAPCQISGIRRTVWDGSQEIGEIQVPNAGLEDDNHVGQGYTSGRNLSPFYGAVAYVYDGRVDQPVAVTRLRYSNLTPSNTIQQIAPFTFYPIWSVRGEADFGYTTESASECASTVAGGERVTCISFVKKERWLPYRQVTDWQKSWQGTLVEDKVGTSGLMYRRNRYYDPGTGRFTQEDPIGVAGGLNLYGFAKGDPVTYRDPYGLKADSVILHGSPAWTKIMEDGFHYLADQHPWFRTAYNAIASSSEANVHIFQQECHGGMNSCQFMTNRRTARIELGPRASARTMTRSLGHEFMHAAGDLSGIVPTGIDPECGRPDGGANGCIAYYSQLIEKSLGLPTGNDEDAADFARRKRLP
jgi:RHS repeat-associated protein